MMRLEERDPANQFAMYASSVCYSLRNATRELDAVIDYLRNSKVIREEVDAKGISPDNAANYLDNLRKNLDLVKGRFEVQIFGKAEDATKRVADDPDRPKTHIRVQECDARALADALSTPGSDF